MDIDVVDPFPQLRVGGMLRKREKKETMVTPCDILFSPLDYLVMVATPRVGEALPFGLGN